MIPQDLHTHTRFSCDSQAEMSEMCRAALTQGVQVLGITEHFDLIPEDPCQGFFQADDWWESFHRCQEQFKGLVSLRAGIEIGEPHRFAHQVDQLLDSYPWDYALGSLHWVGNRMVFDKETFTAPPTEVYSDYFEELVHMVREGRFSVLSHMDIVKHYGFMAYGRFDPEPHQDPIREVLRLCVERDLALEVNTGPLRRPVAATSPAREILRWYRQEGGRRLTLGSDAHSPEELGQGIDQALRAALEVGFSELTDFTRMKPKELELSGRGE